MVDCRICRLRGAGRGRGGFASPWRSLPSADHRTAEATLNRLIGGDYGAPALVSLTDDIIEVHRFILWRPAKTKVVDDKQV